MERGGAAVGGWFCGLVTDGNFLIGRIEIFAWDGAGSRHIHVPSP